LKRRTEMAAVFTDGDYEPLEVTGPHAAHIIAFARRHQRDAAIVVIPRAFSEATQGGRHWPEATAFDATVIAPGYLVEGSAQKNGAIQLSVAKLFRQIPMAIVKAHAAPKRIRSTRLR
jgi:(1->4)-alpha-D-glucan 1-alpha-D-glucosylmutase